MPQYAIYYPIEHAFDEKLCDSLELAREIAGEEARELCPNDGTVTVVAQVFELKLCNTVRVSQEINIQFED